MKNNMLVVVVIAVVAALGLGFVGGMKYQETKTPTTGLQTTANGQFRGRIGGQRNGINNGMAVRGKVISSDDTSVTVQLADGSTKIVLVDSKTIFSQSTTATKADVKNGDTVAAFGTTNSDGSVTAQTVQLRPM